AWLSWERPWPRCLCTSGGSQSRPWPLPHKAGAPVPGVEVRAEGFALLAHHAEAVPAGCFHHPPALAELDLPCAQLLQAGDLALDVVGFDVEMDATVVSDLLQQQDRLVGIGIQHRVAAIAVIVRRG